MKYKIYIAILIGLFTTKAKAFDINVEGLYYNIKSLDNKECELTYNSEDKYVGHIVIPSTISYQNIDFTVVAIGSEAFMNCTELESVTIPPTVTYISSGVFQNCYGLNKVILQDTSTPIHLTYNSATSSGYKEGEGTFVKSSLREIYIGRPIEFTEKINCGYSPFYKLKSLRKVVFSDNVKTFGTRCFYECSNLEEITFSSSIESIPNFSFIGCVSLRELVFNEGLKSIGSESFKGCTGLTNISFPSTLISLNSSFRDCTGLTSIELPESALEIGWYTFCGCTNLKNIVLPQNLSSLSQSLFEGCSSLEHIEIPSHVTSLGSSCFMGCSALANIEIPEGVTSIDSYCFSNCTELSALTLPENVKSLGWSIVDGCSKLKNLYLKPLTPPVCEERTFAEIAYINTQLNVSPESYNLYKSTTPWNKFLKIQESDFSSSVDTIEEESSEEIYKYYNLNGSQIEKPTRGIYIKTSKNGQSYKIIK